MSSAYEEPKPLKDLEPSRAKADEKAKEKLQAHAGATVSNTAAASNAHLLQQKPKEEEKVEAVTSTESKAGAQETREALKDPDALMKRPEPAKEKEHDVQRLTGPLASLKHFPPELFDALKALEELLLKGVTSREFEAKLRETIPDTKVQAEVRTLAGPHLLGKATTSDAPPSATADAA